MRFRKRRVFPKLRDCCQQQSLVIVDVSKDRLLSPSPSFMLRSGISQNLGESNDDDTSNNNNNMKSNSNNNNNVGANPKHRMNNPGIRYFTVKPAKIDPRPKEAEIYRTYDPLTGIRTAAILGLFLLTIILYILYKSRYSRTRWTQKDRLFIEIYKKKLQERRDRRRTRSDIRTAVRGLIFRPNLSLVPDPTANRTTDWRSPAASPHPAVRSCTLRVEKVDE